MQKMRNALLRFEKIANFAGFYAHTRAYYMRIEGRGFVALPARKLQRQENRRKIKLL